MEARSLWSVVAWALVLLGGLALRVWVFASPLGVVDADEAIGTLLARHMADGEWSTFLWGNAYGGTLEALVAVPLIWIWDSDLVLKVVMVAMYAAACVLTWRVGERTVGAAPARFAAAALWVAPAPFLLASTKGRLYYGSALVLAMGVLLLCLRLVERPARRDMVLLGVVLGLGLWTAPFVFYVAVPACAWLMVRARLHWRLLPLAVPGFLVGAFPWLKYNLATDWASFTQKPTPPTSYRERLGDFFTEVLPRGLDLRARSGSWVGGTVGQAVFLALLALFAGAAVWSFRHRSRLAVLVMIGCAYPFLYAVPRGSWHVAEPRYALFLFPLVSLLIAAGLFAVPRAKLVAPGAAGLFLVTSALSLGALERWAAAHPGNHDLTPVDTAPLVDHLDAQGVTEAIGDYWLAYPVTLVSRERIVVIPTGDSRYAPYEQRLNRAGGTNTFIHFSGSAQDSELRQALAKNGMPYQATPVDRFTVYRLAKPVRLGDFG